jgi:hypothetical protein
VQPSVGAGADGSSANAMPVEANRMAKDAIIPLLMITPRSPARRSETGGESVVVLTHRGADGRWYKPHKPGKHGKRGSSYTKPYPYYRQFVQPAEGEASQRSEANCGIAKHEGTERM